MKVIQTKITQTYYNEIDFHSLHIGEILVVNIFIKRNYDYVIIIEAGTLLSQALYNKLTKQEKLYITKKDAKKKELNSHTLYTHMNYNKHNLEKSLDLLYQVNNKTFNDFFNSKEQTIDIVAIGEVVKSIILFIQSNKHLMKEIISHFVDSDEVAEHCLHVAIYSINLGHSLEFTNKQLMQLGTAALLHDIGHKKINETIRHKDSQLNISELEEMRMHSKYSAEIAKINHIADHIILDAILHHHEYQDGTGYPHGLNVKTISIFASILCISDIFDALTNKRTYREKHSTFDALSTMMKDENMKYKFNQKYVKVFLESFLL